MGKLKMLTKEDCKIGMHIRVVLEDINTANGYYQVGHRGVICESHLADSDQIWVDFSAEKNHYGDGIWAIIPRSCTEVKPFPPECKSCFGSGSTGTGTCPMCSGSGVYHAAHPMIKTKG